MARLPPNQPSRHRSRGRSSQATNRSGNLASESSTANSISRSTCYSSGAQRADTLATLTEDSGSSTPNLIEDSGSSMPTTTPGLLVESTRASCTSRSGASVVSTPTSSRSVTDDLVVPSPPERRSDYLTPLNLSSTINRGGSTSANVSPAFGHDFMAKMEAFFERQKELNDRLEQRVAEHLEKERENLRPAQSRRLPKGISAIVRDVYTSLSGPGGQELRWDLTKSFSDPSNNMVNAAIMDGVRSTDTTTSVNIIRAAMRVHFRTKKRGAKNIALRQDQRILKEQRIRSRKNTKRLKRSKVLKQSTAISEEDKAKYLPLMTSEYMSSEDSLSESEDHNSRDSETSDVEQATVRVLCVRPLTWRSRELNDLMASLDRKVARRQSQKSANMTMQRRTGPNSNRQAPLNAPAFALQ